MTTFLENKFYSISEEHRNDDTQGYFIVNLIPDSEVYKGHFPGDPVCPGVCNIETIKECACRLTKKSLFIKAIKQCRLTAVATPTECPWLKINISLTDNNDGTYMIVADVSNDKQTYMMLKGTLTDSITQL